ncbi:MAG: hypothetical protein ACRDNY_13550 [Gaiellaceae bacterium]
MTETASTPPLTIVPAHEASWEDLQAVFGTRGAAAACQCQRYKLRPRESFASFPAEERAFRLRTQTDCGHFWAVTCVFTRAGFRRQGISSCGPPSTSRGDAVPVRSRDTR